MQTPIAASTYSLSSLQLPSNQLIRYTGAYVYKYSLFEKQELQRQGKVIIKDNPDIVIHRKKREGGWAWR